MNKLSLSHNPTASSFLEGHLVGVLSFAEGEVVPEVALEHRSLLVLLDDVEHLLVEVGLVLLLLVGGLVRLLLGGEDVALLLGSLLGGLDATEVVVVQLVGDGQGGDVQPGGGGQKVTLVHAAERAAVDLVGAWKPEERTLMTLLISFNYVKK